MVPAGTGTASGGVSTGGANASSGTSNGDDAGTSSGAHSTESGGCGCRVAGQPSGGSLASLLGLVGLAEGTSRRLVREGADFDPDVVAAQLAELAWAGLRGIGRRA